MGQVIPTNYVSVAIPHKYLSTHYGLITLGVYDFESQYTVQEVIDHVVEAWAENCGVLIDSAVVIGPGIGTVQLSEGNYATTEGIYSSTGLVSGGNTQPPAVSVIVRKITARPGRTGRGRMFIPWGVQDSDVGEDGTIAGGAVESWESAIQFFNDALIALEIAPVILHNEGVPGGVTPSVITGWAVENVVGTQRRRQRR